MNRTVIGLSAWALLCGSVVARADFKYTQSGKITGGMMAGVMKFAGAFSKQAREPVETTYYVKGNRMRTDEAMGRAKIIDLDARHIIDIDGQHKTYSIVSFDDMKAAIESAKEKQTKMKGNSQDVKMVPKFDVTQTESTKELLGQTTHEVKVKIEMQYQSDDPEKQKQMQGMSTTITSDMWIAPDVKGYDEVRQFHERMAKELDWLPGEIFGNNPQTAEGMAELRKNAATLNGLPLLQYISMGMAGMAQGASTGSQESQGQQGGTTSESGSAQTPSSTPTTPGGALAKGLGGMFGGFGRKKKQQSTEDQTQSSQGGSAQAGSGSGSLMDMTSEVTEYSADPLDGSLFEIPAGYKQVQADAEKIVTGRR